MTHRGLFAFALACILQLPLYILAQTPATQGIIWGSSEGRGIIWGSSVPGANVDRPEKPSDDLATYRAEYPDEMSFAQVAEMLNRVAWDYRDTGMKLLGKEAGANCPMPNGTLISCDYLVHSRSFTGFDVVSGAGPGGPSRVQTFTWGLGPEDFIDALKKGERTFVDPIEPEAFLLLKKPAKAEDVFPKNQDGQVPVTTTQLKWAGNGDDYDVYFGTVNPPPLQAFHPLTVTTVDVGPLASGTIYFWRIDAKNAKGVTPGMVWSFATVIVAPAPLPSADPVPPTTTPVDLPTRGNWFDWLISHLFGLIYCLGGHCN